MQEALVSEGCAPAGRPILRIGSNNVLEGYQVVVPEALDGLRKVSRRNRVLDLIQLR